MSTPVIPRLHLISDGRVCDLERLPDVARRAISGGVDAVHLREKSSSPKDLVAAAISLRAALASEAALFINDRVDVALICRTTGVQLGEESLPVRLVRDLVGKRMLIGRSVHDVDGARKAQFDGADFVIAGHVFDTASKPGQPGRGLPFIESIARECSVPVIAIGGITAEHVGPLLRAGAHGVAVLSGILAAADPAEAARQYAEALKYGDEINSVDH